MARRPRPGGKADEASRTGLCKLNTAFVISKLLLVWFWFISVHPLPSHGTCDVRRAAGIVQVLLVALALALLDQTTSKVAVFMTACMSLWRSTGSLS